MWHSRLTILCLPVLYKVLPIGPLEEQTVDIYRNISGAMNFDCFEKLFSLRNLVRTIESFTAKPALSQIYFIPFTSLIFQIDTQ